MCPRYCREAGVRHLEKEIEKICRKGYKKIQYIHDSHTDYVLLHAPVARKVVSTMDAQEAVPTDFVVEEDQVLGEGIALYICHKG